MSEAIYINAANKEERYRQLLPQVKALLEGETDLIANLANLCAALKELPGFFWVGFYLLKDNTLVLGPFQGPVACTRINKGKGVCGTAWQKNETIIVDDVDSFPGHIACSALSRGEIVIPVYNSTGQFAGVLDVDSADLAAFDKTDEHYLKQLLSFLNF